MREMDTIVDVDVRNVDVGWLSWVFNVSIGWTGKLWCAGNVDNSIAEFHETKGAAYFFKNKYVTWLQ